MSYVYVFFTTVTHPSYRLSVAVLDGPAALAGAHKEGAMSQDDKSVLSSEQNRILVTELADRCTLGRII
jgi:hypothetical protein